MNQQDEQEEKQSQETPETQPATGVISTAEHEKTIKQLNKTLKDAQKKGIKGRQLKRLLESRFPQITEDSFSKILPTIFQKTENSLSVVGEDGTEIAEPAKPVKVINAYVCDDLHFTVTIDRDKGTAPVLIKCEQCVNPDGLGMAMSRSYRVNQSFTPSHEFYKPNEEELKAMSETMNEASFTTIKDHAEKGGLFIRRIANV